MADKIVITIPKDLKQKLNKKLKETNFKSISDYILYILKQVFSDTITDSEKKAYSEEEEADIRGPDIYSEEEELALKKNLEDLGYI